MSIRRSPAFVLLGLSLLAAACGESNSTKSSSGDAVGMGEAEGAAAGTSPGSSGASGEAMESLGPGQDGTAANDTVPHRPEEAMPQQP